MLYEFRTQEIKKKNENKKKRQSRNVQNICDICWYEHLLILGSSLKQNLKLGEQNEIDVRVVPYSFFKNRSAACAFPCKQFTRFLASSLLAEDDQKTAHHCEFTEIKFSRSAYVNKV